MLLCVTLLQGGGRWCGGSDGGGGGGGWGGKGGWGVVPILGKLPPTSLSSPFISTPSQIKIFIYSIYPFLLQHPFLPAPTPPFNRLHLLEK